MCAKYVRRKFSGKFLTCPDFLLDLYLDKVEIPPRPSDAEQDDASGKGKEKVIKR